MSGEDLWGGQFGEPLGEFASPDVQKKGVSVSRTAQWVCET